MADEHAHLRLNVSALADGKLPARVNRATYQNLTLACARYEFFSLLDEEVPEVREELKSQVFPPFDAALKAVAPNVRVLDEYGLRSQPEPVAWFFGAMDAGDEGVLEVADLLRQWGERHHLKEPWVADTALRTMVAWSQDHAWLKSKEWVVLWPAWKSPLSQEEKTLLIELADAWDPSIETRRDARERLIRRARHQIDEFLDRCLGLADERGFVEPPLRKTPGKHLRWLVRYQIVGQSFTKIALEDSLPDPDGSGRKTVSNGVSQAAELVGLALRARDRGALST